MSLPDFLEQYHASGREKGDGYSAGMFEDLTADERRLALGLLLVRGLAGDTVDLAGLRYVADEDAIARLRAAQGQGPFLRPDRDMVRRETLFQLTGEPTELMPLLAYIDGRADQPRRQAAELLAQLPLPSVFADLIALRLTSWRWRDLALPLATAWLNSQGQAAYDVSGFQSSLPLVRAIVDRPWWRRAALLREITTQLQSQDHA